MTPTLITIAVSHFCEKARWGLQRCNIRFDEEAHPPALHWQASFRRGGKRTVPVLVTEQGALADSTDILKYADGKKPGALYPGDVRSEVEALEDTFDEKLGPHARRLVYGHILHRREVAVPVLTLWVSRREQVLFSTMYPVISRLMARGMNVTPQKVAESRDRVQRIFDDVAARLSDGRRFLVGDRFTAADLTLASLGALVVEPTEYGCPYADKAPSPPGLRDDVAHFRAHPAGQFILRIYREQRAVVL